jgi:hypothetical protein
MQDIEQLLFHGTECDRLRTEEQNYICIVMVEGNHGSHQMSNRE